MIKRLNKSQIIGAIFVIAVFIGALFLSYLLSQNSFAQEMVASFGYLGVAIIALVSGFNTIVPVPAGTFIPVFLSAGLSAPMIILTLALATTVADLAGYFLGYVGREVIEEKYPKLFSYFSRLQKRGHRFVIPVIFLYAAFVPFPNEVLIIPLAISGYKLKHLIIPLVLGNFLHHTVFMFGITNLFDLIQ